MAQCQEHFLGALPNDEPNGQRVIYIFGMLSPAVRRLSLSNPCSLSSLGASKVQDFPVKETFLGSTPSLGATGHSPG